MIHLTSCEYAPDQPSDGRMTPAEFSARLPKVAFPLHWFADYTGANLRTVERWADGVLDIPPWVSRMLWLHESLSVALAWIEEQCPPDTITDKAREALWAKDEAMLADRAARRESQRQARRAVSAPSAAVVDHIDGNPLNNDLANLRVVSASENLR